MATTTQGRRGHGFRIMDAAREVGVSPSAIRLWERQGLIQPRREPNGERRYTPSDIERLRTIHRFRHADGLNAAAILRLLPPGTTSRPLGGVAPLDAIARDPRLALVRTTWPEATDGDPAAADRPATGARSGSGTLSAAGAGGTTRALAGTNPETAATELPARGLDRANPTRDGDRAPTREPAQAPVPRRLRPPGRGNPGRTRSRAIDGISGAAPTSLGPALRAARLERRLTLRAAASSAGLSASFVSALERGVTGASLSTLKRLTGVYGTTVAGLLRGSGIGAGRLVRALERRVAAPGDGIRIEDLATSPTQLESQLFVLAAGASSDGYYAHPGEEFMFVLDGRLAVWLDEVEYYELDPGDALTFPSTLEHRFRALGPDETRLLWVNTPPTF